MKKHRVAVAVLWLLALASPLAAQGVRQEIQFPDVAGYQTLKCDLHMHTVFSDGAVWPTVRVQEAWRLGLDVIAITDHIEYQPHKDDVPTRHARSCDLAAGAARQANLLLIRGAEITRDTPPGHFNAIFLTDQAALDTPEFLDAIQRANQQGAFVFWNHQGWKGPEKGRWLEVHTTMLQNKWFQGMEVCNGDDYYPDAHRWCLEKNLTMLGNSDIHDPDLNQRSQSTNHRTMTLLLAKQRTPEGVKEALLAGRTVVWYKDRLIGRKEWLEPLFAASVQVDPPHLRTKDAVFLTVRNLCEADFVLQRTGKVGPQTLTLPARSTSLLKISTPAPAQALALEYTVTNLWIAPETGLPVRISVPGERSGVSAQRRNMPVSQ